MMSMRDRMRAVFERVAKHSRGKTHWVVASVAAVVWSSLALSPADSLPTPQLLGAAPSAWTEAPQGNEAMVQIRAVLQFRSEDNDSLQALASPSATTLFSTATSIEQTVRLSPLHEFDVVLRATPRQSKVAKSAQANEPLVIEEELEIIERKRTWWGFSQENNLILRSQVLHHDAARRTHRVEFRVDTAQFALETSAQLIAP
jgi:hypothetical protein